MASKNLRLTEIATLLGLTERRVQQLAADKVIPPPTERGIYAWSCVTAYCDFLRNGGAVDLDSGDDPQTAKPRLADFNLARAELTQRQAEKAALEVAELRSDLIPLEGAVAVQAAIAGAVREQLRSMTSKLVVRHPDMDQATQDDLDSLVHQALDELSSKKLSRQLRATLARDYERIETASEPVAERVG